MPVKRKRPLLSRLIVWTLWGLVILVGLGSLAAAGGYLWLRGSLPDLDGQILAAGLSAPAEILRDPEGIVTIRAQNESDAAFALGFAHAQDRLWQMDFTRRSGAGRIAEVVGARALPFDRFMRTLGLYRVAEANLTALPDDTRAVLDAYTGGVNAFLAARNGPLPLEFQILRYTPEPWKPADSLVWGRLMALQLSGNWRDEVLHARLAKRLTAEQIGFLWPAYPKDAPTTLKDLADATGEMPLERFADILPWELAPKDASNAWVLDGTRTESGAPILANDPHLALSAPGTWYLARIETPERTLSGATVPGLPFLMLGQNGDVAWGMTTTHSDTQDLFIERVVEGDPASYETPEGPRAFVSRQEIIEVQGQAPETWTVRETRHGPVLSDAIAVDLDDVRGSGTVLALAWPALRADDRTGVAFHRMNRARNAGEFRAALQDFNSPQQNIVYADRAGQIGFAAPGRVPIRKAGDGRHPVPGWSGATDWRGEIPFQELPLASNPAEGSIVSANNKIVPDSYRYLLTADWQAPYRAERIETLLNGGKEMGWTLERTIAAQLDLASPAARALLPLLLSTQATSARGAEALAILRAWDGRMTRDAAAPLILYAWAGALTEALMADELGPAFKEFRAPKLAILTNILRDAPAWCDDVTSGVTETCADELSRSLESALESLDQRFRRPLDQLRWGEAHLARFAHPILRNLPLADTIFGYPLETPGGTYTINRGGAAYGSDPAKRFENIHGPGYRAIYDLGEPDNSRFMIATGQSGNPLSVWYGNLAEQWRDGQYLKLVGPKTVTRHRLRLTPP